MQAACRLVARIDTSADLSVADLPADGVSPRHCASSRGGV